MLNLTLIMIAIPPGSLLSSCAFYYEHLFIAMLHPCRRAIIKASDPTTVKYEISDISTYIFKDWYHSDSQCASITFTAS